MLRNMCVIGAAAIAVVSALDVSPVSAQTYEACRIPTVGVIYMINVGDAPTECLDATHVPFSWTEGGAPGSGTVTSDMIADGTIAPADIANGAVTTAKLAVPIRHGFTQGSSSPYTLSGTNQNVNSVSVTVGGAGFVLVQANGGTALGAGCSVNFGISETSGGAPVLTNYAYRSDTDATSYGYIPLAVSYADPVASAGTYTYYFVANASGTGTCYAYARGMTALFIPS